MLEGRVLDELSGSEDIFEMVLVVMNVESVLANDGLEGIIFIGKLFKPECATCNNGKGCQD